MDLTLFIIIIIVIIFIYYLINVIKELQIEIKNMSLNCNNKTSIATFSTQNNDTIDIKLKKDVVSILDYIKNYFI
jgi:hypothetical protein